jgi:hypothetical protein
MLQPIFDVIDLFKRNQEALLRSFLGLGVITVALILYRDLALSPDGLTAALVDLALILIGLWFMTALLRFFALGEQSTGPFPPFNLAATLEVLRANFLVCLLMIPGIIIMIYGYAVETRGFILVFFGAAVFLYIGFSLSPYIVRAACQNRIPFWQSMKETRAMMAAFIPTIIVLAIMCTLFAIPSDNGTLPLWASLLSLVINLFTYGLSFVIYQRFQNRQTNT